MWIESKINFCFPCVHSVDWLGLMIWLNRHPAAISLVHEQRSCWPYSISDSDTEVRESLERLWRWVVHCIELYHTSTTLRLGSLLRNCADKNLYNRWRYTQSTTRARQTLPICEFPDPSPPPPTPFNSTQRRPFILVCRCHFLMTGYTPLAYDLAER